MCGRGEGKGRSVRKPGLALGEPPAIKFTLSSLVSPQQPPLSPQARPLPPPSSPAPITCVGTSCVRPSPGPWLGTAGRASWGVMEAEDGGPACWDGECGRSCGFAQVLPDTPSEVGWGQALGPGSSGGVRGALPVCTEEVVTLSESGGGKERVRGADHGERLPTRDQRRGRGGGRSWELSGRK